MPRSRPSQLFAVAVPGTAARHDARSRTAKGAAYKAARRIMRRRRQIDPEAPPLDLHRLAASLQVVSPMEAVRDAAPKQPPPRCACLRCRAPVSARQAVLHMGGHRIRCESCRQTHVEKDKRGRILRTWHTYPGTIAVIVKV